MTDDTPGALRELARLQGGVATGRQAFEAGLTKAAVKWQIRCGHWQRLERGIYALFSGPPGRETVLWAAVLRAGRDAMFSHQTAAELARLIDAPSASLHLTVPASRRVQRLPGMVIHTSIYTAASRHPTLLPPRTRIEDTVLDLAARAVTFDNACGWVTRACGRGLTTRERLRTAMGRRGRLRWREPLTQLLADTAGGTHSVLEFRYYRDVERAHGLPQAIRQARVVRERRNEYRDVLYAQYLVVVEVDGRLAHPAAERWQDIRRDNAAVADGCVTLRYGWPDITGQPCRTAAEVARVLTSRGWPGPPRSCGPSCSIRRSA